jgi:hypothetical protein
MKTHRKFMKAQRNLMQAQRNATTAETVRTYVQAMTFDDGKRQPGAN